MPDHLPVNPSHQASSDKELAAELIRQKIKQLYAQEQTESPLPASGEQVHSHNSHQQFIQNLAQSGKSLEEIQTAWHAYYVDLPDAQKHEVWQQFYSNSAKSHKSEAATSTDAKIAAQHQRDAKPASPKTVSHIRHQISNKVSAQGKLKVKHHLQALLFGFGAGSLVILILLFSFFNERVIAPFIQPSSVVSNTPIIADSSDVVGPVSEVIIPKINVEIPVVYDQPSVEESAIETSLESGVVHYATTPYPGQLGNGVIFGHSSNNILNPGHYKFAFVLLHNLTIGDTFMLTKDGKRYTYRVYSRSIVSPTQVGVLGNTDKPATFSLITCDPPGTSINRLVVIGQQISPDPSGNTASTAEASSNAPATIPSNSVSLWNRLTSWL